MAPLLASRRADRAFERMYRKHVHDVYRYSLAMLRNPADAEDVTQTTFLNAYRAFERGERPREAQNWLITIAHNVCRQRFRNAARRPSEVEWDDHVSATVPEDDDGPTIAEVQRALAHLPFNQRSALVMRELEGRSYAEIAETLELTVSAVETLIFRARRALREQIEGSLTCVDAERAISRQLDGRLSRDERAGLRAHLRECKDCERHARRVRAQRAALKGLGAVPLPASLISWGGGGAAAAGGTVAGIGLATKAAAVVVAGLAAAGAGKEIADRASASAAPPTRRVEVAPAAVASAATPVVVMTARPTATAAAKPARSKAQKAKPNSPARRSQPAAAAERGAEPVGVAAGEGIEPGFRLGRAQQEAAAAAREEKATAKDAAREERRATAPGQAKKVEPKAKPTGVPPGAAALTRAKPVRPVRRATPTAPAPHAKRAKPSKPAPQEGKAPKPEAQENPKPAKPDPAPPPAPPALDPVDAQQVVQKAKDKLPPGPEEVRIP